MRARTRRLYTFGIVALLVLAGLQLLAQGTPAARPPAPEATDPGTGESPSQVQLPQFCLPPVEEFAETLARPLFYEARQPPDSSPANELDPQPQSNSGSAETLIISAIVLTGEGPTFSAGQDLSIFTGPVDASNVREAIRTHYKPLITRMVTMPKIIIGAINGGAAGAGASD